MTRQREASPPTLPSASATAAQRMPGTRRSALLSTPPGSADLLATRKRWGMSPFCLLAACAAGHCRPREDEVAGAPLGSCRSHLPATAGATGLPRGSASVVRQLGRAATRIWIGRGRRIARREALGAQVATGEQRLRAREGRAWRVLMRVKHQFKPFDEGCKNAEPI